MEMWFILLYIPDTMKLFEHSSKNGVVFVPAQPFYTDDKPKHAARLNYSSLSAAPVETGVSRLCESYEQMTR